MQIIKHTFNVEEGRQIEIALIPLRFGVADVCKRREYDGVCYYTACGYYLDSDDDSHHREYDLDEIIRYVVNEDCTDLQLRDFKRCYWSH